MLFALPQTSIHKKSKNPELWNNYYMLFALPQTPTHKKSKNPEL